MIAVRNHIQDLLQALRTRTGRQTQLVFMGEAVSAVLGFALNVLLLRVLGVDEYGTFALFSATMMLLAGFVHFGWSETLVRFGAKYRDRVEFEAIRSHAFSRVVLGASALALVAVGASSWLCVQVYKRPEFVPYFQLGVFGAWSSCLFTFFQNDRRAKQEMRAVVVWRVGSSLARLVVLSGAWILSWFSLQLAVWTYAFVPILFVLPALLRELKRHFRPMKYASVRPELADEMANYTGWMFLSMATTHLIGNVDSHIIAYFHPNTVLSSFTAAARLTLPIQIAVLAMTTTLLPRLSASRDLSEIHLYVKRVTQFLIPLSAAILLAIWIAPPILIWVSGPKYEDISTLLRLQMTTTWIILLTNPFGLILYAWGRTRMLAMMNVAQLIVNVGLDLWWVPTWGAAGAIVSTLVVNLIGMVTIYIGVVRGLKEKTT